MTLPATTIDPVSHVQPDVSVIIPTRNRLAMLQQTLSTVLGQRGVQVEAVIVDEGSSDGTAAWLSELDDPRVKVLRHDPPVRLPGARNAGVRAATADFVAFVDDDDLWGLDKLRLQLDAQRAAGALWSYTGSVHVDEHLRPVAVHYAPSPPSDPQAFFRDIVSRNLVPGGGSGVLVSRTALIEAGGFNEDLRAAEDWECWIRLAERGNVPAAVPEPMVAYRRLANSMSHEIDRMLVSLSAVVDLHPEIEGDPKFGVPRGALCDLARLAREGGDWSTAVRLLWQDRGRLRTWLRVPTYLLLPQAVMRRSFYLRRSRVRWAQPLVDEVAHFSNHQ